MAALLLALTLAVLGAVLTAGRGRIAKAVATTIELVAVSVPAFWLGIVLLSVFSFRLRLFPVAGGSGVEGLVLPAVALAVPIAGVLAQVIRQELATADGRPFVLTARSEGSARPRFCCATRSGTPCCRSPPCPASSSAA
nr:ABC transporter permease subunit [Thermostaphylospora chromogena]